MHYRPMDRIRLAWRWLPVELLIVSFFLVLGWGLDRLIAKPVYHAELDITITRKLRKNASKVQRQRQFKKDVEQIDQFRVLPHQGNVLYAASGYAYAHYGIVQGVQDFSEAVTTTTVTGQPTLRLTTASTDAMVAVQNRRAFEDALIKDLKQLKHYRVTTVQRPLRRPQSGMQLAILKVMLISGCGVALLTPYIVQYGREGRERHA